MTLVVWFAGLMMLAGAVFLVAGIGASALWFAVIAIGIAIVVIDRARSHHHPSL